MNILVLFTFFFNIVFRGNLMIFLWVQNLSLCSWESILLFINFRFLSIFGFILNAHFFYHKFLWHTIIIDYVFLLERWNFLIGAKGSNMFKQRNCSLYSKLPFDRTLNVKFSFKMRVLEDPIIIFGGTMLLDITTVIILIFS